MTDYRERHRPQLHFSPPHGWMNDPNGMVYLDGKYHLFYQFHPHATVWGPMHWGHAISEDMVRWQHRPVALEPDELGFIWSGSAVYDKDNTSGLGENGRGPLVCIYTYHNDEIERSGTEQHEYQGLAFSNDGGETWHKYAHNPVLPNEHRVRDFRDPKVFWHAPTNEWVMVLAAGHEAQFWASANLIQWEFRSSFGAHVGAHEGIWECPDLISVPIADSADRRWVLIQSLNPGGPQGGSGTQYFVGDFDGTTFTLCPEFAQSRAEGTGVWLDHGPDCYAGVTWSNVPVADGRVLFLGWLSNWDYAGSTPTDTWRGAMTVARSLELRQQGGCLRLTTAPVEELERFRMQAPVHFNGRILPGEERSVVSGMALSPTDIQINVSRPERGQLELSFCNTEGEVFRLGYDADKSAFFADRSEAGDMKFSPRQFPRRHWVSSAASESADSELNMRIVLDTSSVEVFFNDGEISYSALLFPSEPYSALEISTSNRPVNARVEIFPMESIWSLAC